MTEAELKGHVFILMAEQELTYAELARRMGITVGSVYPLVKSLGTRKHQPALLARLARAFGKPNDYFARLLTQTVTVGQEAQGAPEPAETSLDT